MRPAPRAIAVLLALLGLAAVPRPLDRVDPQGASQARAALSRAGERGHVPAIRSDAGVERQVAHEVPLALPPAPAALPVALLAAASRHRVATRPAGIAAARANRARAPPPAA